MEKYNKTVLIVDDDIDYLFQMKTVVESFGFKTITAESQKEGEEILDQQKPDICIFDLMMESDDSGFVLCYRGKKKYPDMPIILATAVVAETGVSFSVDSEEDKQWIKADLYMDKGIRPDQLHREMLNLLKLK